MHKINCKQIFVMTFFLTCTLFTGFGVNYLMRHSSTTTIITIPIGMLVGLIPISIMLYISNFTTDKNLFELLKTKYKKLGTLINTLIFISVVIMGAASIWNSINFTVSQFLTKTPYFIIMLLFFFTIIIPVIRGHEIIGRTAIILFPTFIILISLASIGVTNKVDLSNIKPILNISTKQFLTSTLAFATYSSLPIFLLLSIKKNDIVDKKNYKKSVVWGYISSCLLVLIFTFLMISIFGIDLAKLYTYPEYSLFKEVEAFKFIEKFENIFALTIYITFFIFNSIGNFFLKKYFITTFNPKNQKRETVITIIASFILWLSTTITFTKFHPNILLNQFPIFTIPIIIIFLIVSLMLFISKIKEKV